MANFFTRFIARLTGISTPVVGVSWLPPTDERATAEAIIAFLEDRRVLWAPYDWTMLPGVSFYGPKLHQYPFIIKSVFEIRQHLTEQLEKLPSASQLADHLRAMRSACHHFINNVDDAEMFIHGPEILAPFEIRAMVALGEMRALFGGRINQISRDYGIEIKEPQFRALLEAYATGEPMLKK